jgi:hypothetical protein
MLALYDKLINEVVYCRRPLNKLDIPIEEVKFLRFTAIEEE